MAELFKGVSKETHQLSKNAKKMIEIITAIRIHNNNAAEVKNSLGYNLRLKRRT